MVLAVSFAAFVGTRDDAQAADEPWTYASAMSQRRSYIAAAEVAGQVYAVGGMVGETGRFLSVAQRFDPQANSWSRLPRLPEAVRAGAGAALDGKVYVIGGQTEDRDGRQVYALDVRVRDLGGARTLPRAPLQHGRGRARRPDLRDGRLQGGGGTRRRLRLRPGVRLLERRHPLPAPNHTFGAVVFDGEIWAIGGRRGEEVLHDVWIYNPETDRWRPGPPLPEPMELVGAAVPGTTSMRSGRARTRSTTGAPVNGVRPRPLVTRHGLKAFAVAARSTRSAAARPTSTTARWSSSGDLVDSLTFRGPSASNAFGWPRGPGIRAAGTYKVRGGQT